MKVKTNYGEFPLVGYRHMDRRGVHLDKPRKLTKLWGAVVLQPDGKHTMLVLPMDITNWHELPQLIEDE